MGGHGRYRVFRRIRTIRITVAGFVEREVDLGETEAGDRHIETQVDQALEFDREDLAVPASIQRELVVGEDIGPSIVGTDFMPSRRAASTRPWPAMISPSSDTSTGFVKPKRSMLSAICRICFLECVRALRAYGFSEETLRSST